MAESGTRREIVYTFAMPYARMSTWPEMRRISRYLPTVFLFFFNAFEISVTLIPPGFFLRRSFMATSSCS